MPNKFDQEKIDTMKAFEMADKNTPRDKIGRARYGMGSNGMPRTPAQQDAVRKAARASAIARKGRGNPLPGRAPGAVAAPGPGGKIKPEVPGVSTGSLSIAKPKKGLLSL